MQIRRTIFVLLVILAVGLAPSAFGQLASQFPLSHRELGYYDHATGIFTPLHPVAQDAELAPAVTPTTGEFIFNITITLKSALPKNGVITCDGSVFVNDPSGFSAQENGFAVATGSGTSWSCKVTIFYSWLLSSASTDMVALNYQAGIGEGIQITATNGTGTAIEFGNVRSSHQNIAPIKVPANGATTTETISITL